MTLARGVLVGISIIVATAHAGPPSSTVVKRYEYEPPEPTIGKVPGTLPAKALGTDRVVRIGIPTWAGWAPLVWANRGGKPKQVWKDGKGEPFLVELVVVDDWQRLADQYAHGELHAGGTTLDQLALIATRLGDDTRTQPHVFQLVDWSNSADGIVSRVAIREVGDLRGKTIVVAQHTASHYLLASMLGAAGLTLADVQLKYTRDAFMAAAAFELDKAIDAAVLWQPEIDKLGGASGNRTLVTTREASRWLAGVWFARGDFAKEHPAIVEGLVRGMLDAAATLPANRKEANKLFEQLFGLPDGTAATMTADAHLANSAENRAFFDAAEPTGFAQTLRAAVQTYAALKLVDPKVEARVVGDGSIASKLAREPRYAAQQVAYPGKLAARDVDFDKRTILTHTIAIGADLAAAAALAKRFGHARIEIGVHLAVPWYGTLLSERWAKQVRQSLVDKHRLDPSQLTAKGYGSSRSPRARKDRIELRFHAW